MEASKPGEAKPRMRVPGPVGIAALMDSARFAAAAVVTTTPFGIPVEPEV